MCEYYELNEKRYEQATTHKLFEFSPKTYVFGNQDH